MTREEAIEYLKRADTTVGKEIKTMTAEALDMAIKALEQEPCEDCVSRQAVLEGLVSIAKVKAKSDTQKSLMGRVMYFVEKLPSVTPQPKVGRWIEHFDQIGKWYECDQCHTDWGGSVNYCPNCGAIMKDK